MPIPPTDSTPTPDYRAELAALRTDVQRLSDEVQRLCALLEGQTAAALEDARGTRAWLRERLQEKL